MAWQAAPLHSPTIGIVVRLVARKITGIAGATFVMARFAKARLDENLRWMDVVGLAVLAGIGLTVPGRQKVAAGTASDAPSVMKITGQPGRGSAVGCPSRPKSRRVVHSVRRYDALAFPGGVAPGFLPPSALPALRRLSI